jgi:cold shock CspA family protein
MTGRIKKLLKDKKCGFILGEDKKEYFFHVSSLKNVNYETLEEGDDVTFEETSHPKGLRAEDVFV